MRRIITTLVAAAVWTAGPAAPLPQRIGCFDISQVRLTDSRFLRNQQADIHYLLGLDADRLLAPYLKEAGLTPKADNYTNWENTGLDGHIGGHYLSALSYMYAATGHQEIERRMDYMLSELARCQQAAGDGYLCGVPGGRQMWQQIARGDIRAGSFGLNDRWVPLYNIHKMYAGLRDARLVAGCQQARQMLVAMTDWMVREVSALSDAQIQQMLVSEHGGLNETFADVYAITGEERFLRLAHQFSDQRILDPLLRGEDRLTGMHANTQIPKIIGYKRIADVEGLDDWNRAAAFFWDVVINHRSVSIGGNSMREHFNPTNDFSELLASEQGPESCNTYNMMRLSKMLYQTSADKQYIDYYERALYNHILSAMNPVQGGFVYFTPMRSGHYRVYSQPQTSMWCCVGTGIENPARYGEMVYAHDGDDLIVNLFIPSVLTWGDMTVTQQNRFPQEPSTELTLQLKRSRKMTMRIRQPWWTEGAAVSVNGKSVKAAVENGYLAVSRTWKDGDRIRIDMPMHLTAMTTPDGKPQYSFLYGPIVLAAKTGTDRQDGMYADDSRGGHIAAGPQIPLSQMPAIVGDSATLLSHLQVVEDRPMTFRLTGLTLPQYEGMLLEPFYGLYECRYQIYFPLYTAAQWQTRKEQLAREEQAQQALESRTTDKVFCGEQQSESDHFFSGPQSWNGSDNGAHWRRTRSMFSYEMKADGAKTVRLTRVGNDRQKVRLSVGGQPVAEQAFDREQTMEVALPAALAKGKIRIEIAAEPGKETPRISEVRLCR